MTMTHDDFVILVNVLFAIYIAVCALIGYRSGSAWQ